MTSNERKIINCLRKIKGETHVRMIAQKANLSSDYARLLCRSLARSGHIKFENDLAYLLKKGRSRFENNDPVADEPMAVAANVTLLTDEPVVASPASDRSDEEENQEEGAGEDKDKDKPTSPVRGSEGSQRAPAFNGISSDKELDKALVDLEPSSRKNESEEKDKPEEPKDEAENEPRELEEEKTEEMAEESKEEISTDKKEDALDKEVLAETGAMEEEKMEKPDETELKPEPKTEEEKETAHEAEMKTATDTADGKEEAKAENPEKVALKEELARPGGGFGASFKKVVNWFAKKK